MSQALEAREIDFREALAVPETEEHRLTRYAAATLYSLLVMGDTPSGLPNDRIVISGDEIMGSNATKPTNIGLFLADLVAARDMELLSGEDADSHVGTILTTLEGLEKDHGLFYDWYSTKDGEKLTIHPSGGPIRPSISSVDNAWLAAGLMTVRAAVPEYAAQADGLLKGMDFKRLYDESEDLFYGEYFPDTGENSSWHYEVQGSEARIVPYIGIAEFGITPESYRHLRNYPKENEGKRTSDDGFIFAWGGGMFEPLLVPQLVPEEEWSNQWLKNSGYHIAKQREQGNEIAQGYWGFSPCDDATGTYHEYGVPNMGLFDGYSRASVVTPHASFLALPYAPQEALGNLAAMELNFPAVYHHLYGFFDSVDTFNGMASPSMLCLDQSMAMLSLAHARDGSGVRKYLAPQLEGSLRPLLSETRTVFQAA